MLRSTFGFGAGIKPHKALLRSPGPILAAQPAPRTVSVRRVSLFFICFLNHQGLPQRLTIIIYDKNNVSYSQHREDILCLQNFNKKNII
jgi:hypothetical protein